jgi:large-conductance mechanosensitive channel
MVTDYVITFISILFLIAVWFIIRKILKSVSNKINNAEAYKEDTLKVLEEIRDELKELNRNNSK